MGVPTPPGEPRITVDMRVAQGEPRLSSIDFLRKGPPHPPMFLTGGTFTAIRRESALVPAEEYSGRIGTISFRMYLIVLREPGAYAC